MPAPKQLKLDVAVTRGPLVESRHRVHAAVVDASGALLASAGDPTLVAFMRSCAKPMQALPLVRAGGLEKFGWGDDELALACASHGGEPEHIAVVARMLASLELEEGDLACGPDTPLSRRGAMLAKDSGAPLTRLHHNCSGKHAAMLARALIAGWPTMGYERSDHRVQIEARAEIASWAGLAPSAVPIGVDGCGVNVFALSLTAMAYATARFAAGIRDQNDAAVARVGHAMIARPFMVGGTERFDTVLIEETDGRLIAKVGAEGVHTVMVPERGVGVAVKVEDGALRAQHCAVLTALKQIGELADPLSPRLAEFLTRPVKNTRGEPVGEIRPL